MKIVFLDDNSIGTDIDLSGFESLGEVVRYGSSKPEEVPERVKDADVVIINKMDQRADHRNGRKAETCVRDCYRYQ